MGFWGTALYGPDSRMEKVSAAPLFDSRGEGPAACSGAESSVISGRTSVNKVCARIAFISLLLVDFCLQLETRTTWAEIRD
jgi:hypothetical protein